MLFHCSYNSGTNPRPVKNGLASYPDCEESAVQYQLTVCRDLRVVLARRLVAWTKRHCLKPDRSSLHGLRVLAGFCITRRISPSRPKHFPQRQQRNPTRRKHFRVNAGIFQEFGKLERILTGKPCPALEKRLSLVHSAWH